MLKAQATLDGAAARQPITLLHVSDIHFGAEDGAALQAVEDFASRLRPDALVAAGDITQSGRNREFEAARAWFDRLGILTIVAPGNHDIPAFHLLHRIPERMLAPFDRYRRHIGELDAVGRLIELRGGAVRLSAINTARGAQGRLNWADGVINLRDLQDTLDLLAEGPAEAWRILVCHHPLREPGHSHISVDTKRGGEALARCAAARIDAIFTGHIHDAFAHPIHSPRRRMVQMGSGTLSTRLRGTHPSFCMVTIEGERIVQDIITAGPDKVEIHRNYDSELHPPGTLFHR
jgi:3',5'-cyclic AMP phosphodiesterase CpdA